MTRRAIWLLAFLFVAVSSAWAQGQFYNTSSSVTQANSAVSFTDNGSGGSAAAFRARYVTIRSLAASANTCYFDMKDTTATTADIALEPGGSFSLTYDGDAQGGWSGLGAICDTGQTATFLITASR